MAERSKAVLKRFSGHFKSRIKFGKPSPSAVPGANARFHDVAWKNLGHAGFADRILWHHAVVRKYPWYDITRVGVF